MSARRDVILVAGLVILALTLHLGLCDWRVHTPMKPATSIVAISHGLAPNPNPFTGQATLMTGVFVDGRVHYVVAVLVGVALPLALLVAAAYLTVALHQRRLIAAGRCRECGHVLATATTCPECGTAR